VAIGALAVDPADAPSAETLAVLGFAFGFGTFTFDLPSVFVFLGMSC